MASKNNNIFFRDDYEALRRLLRPLSYGCYSKDDLIALSGTSKSNVNHWSEYLQDILPEDDAWMLTSHEKQQRLQIKGDSYAGNDNYLAETFFLKSLKKMDVSLLLNILRILNHDGRPGSEGLTVADINDTLYESLPLFLDLKKNVPDCKRATKGEHSKERHERKNAHLPPLVSLDTITSKLEYMAGLGLVEGRGSGREERWNIVPDILAPVQAEDAERLQFAVDFYKNIAPLGVPGFYISAKLGARFHLDEHDNLPFQFVNGDMRRIFDDEVAYQLLRAKELGVEKVSFRYRKSASWLDDAGQNEDKLKKVAPEGILIDDFGGGRQRLLDRNGQTYRLENIYDVRYSQCHNRRKAQTPPQDTRIRLRFHCTDEQHRDALMRSIRSHLPAPSFEEESGSTFLCSFSGGNDALRYMPTLQQYLPYVEILADGDKGLRQRMKADIEEMLDIYEERR